MTDRDHFAAAALTGLVNTHAVYHKEPPAVATMAYAMADAMLRERERTNHDAAPAARAQVDAAGISRQGTGDTPATHATRGEGSEQSEGTEPVAWAVACDYGDYAVALFSDEASAQTEADRRTLVGLRPGCVVVPLYRRPQCQVFSQKNLTLTDAEREAVQRAMASIADTLDYASQQAEADYATLRGLLERLK